MPMRFSVSRNFKFTDLLPKTTPADMRSIGVKLAVRLENRTLQGRDENDQAFVPYGPGYRKVGGRSTVDLHETGAMFEAFGVTSASRTTFGLGFSDPAQGQKAAWHEAGAGRLPVRRFLGVPESWIGDLKAWWLALWDSQQRGG